MADNSLTHPEIDSNDISHKTLGTIHLKLEEGASLALVLSDWVVYGQDFDLDLEVS